MTLLGGFSMGSTSAAGAGAVNMSLDDMIATRRKKDSLQQRMDVASGTRRAKRQAVMDAKRSRTTTAKPTKQQVKESVQKETQKSKQAKAKEAAKTTRKGVKKPAVKRMTKQETSQMKTIRNFVDNAANTTKAGKQSIAALTSNFATKPTKKGLQNAANAIRESGFEIPPGHQLVFTVCPVAENPKKEEPKKRGGKQQQQKQAPQKPSGRGRQRK